MCDATSIVSLALAAGSTYANASSNRKQNNQANSRQRLQTLQNINESQQAADQEFQRANLSFENQQESADRARQRDENQRFADAQVLKPVDRLENFQQNLDDKTAEQQQVFANDLNASVEAGNQNIGSGLEGNVSEAFTSGSADAEQNSLRKAGELGDRRARIAAVSGLLQDDTRAVADAGQQATGTSIAIQRQRELDEYLRQIGENRADLLSRRAPTPVTVL